jgi:hypothetical protein
MGSCHHLAESLTLRGDLFFGEVKSRGRPNDPPDCEAKNTEDQRIAIEVTELVDGLAIHQHKKALAERRPTDWAEWNREKFLSLLVARLEEKDKRFPYLKGTPFPGGYVVIVHTDEPGLSREAVAGYLSERFVLKVQHITRAFLLLSYDPSVEMCPYFEVPICLTLRCTRLAMGFAASASVNSNVRCHPTIASAFFQESQDAASEMRHQSHCHRGQNCRTPPI